LGRTAPGSTISQRATVTRQRSPIFIVLRLRLLEPVGTS
jgi:hypothetical protein